ncbi:class I adenylate-forming enzyme family protein [Sciscionella marina]|uniref:class I adenylate-forming enzyme family protein n=1 Tax=Sciscionella marina TaxID=508770 RepID=UPI000363E985|nr:class I adenylate-forming enzyme family protein [Sciscionella marina]
MSERSPRRDSRTVPDTTIDGILHAAATAWPERTAIRTQDADISFAELDSTATRCAGIIASKLGAWHAVGVVTTLSVEFAAVFYGIARSGNTIVTINPLLRDAAFEHILRSAEVRMVFVPRSLVDRFSALARNIPQLLRIIALDPEDDSAPRLAGFLRDGADRTPGAPDPGPGSLACLQFTSGTTGAPKAVMLSHRNLVSNAAQVAWAHALTEETRILNHLPCYHLMHLNSAIYAGARQTLCHATDSVAALELANSEGAHRFYSLPVHLATLAARDEELPALETVTAILSGGSALPAAAARTLSERLRVPVLQGYGLAEAAPLTHSDSLTSPKPGSVGYPLAGTECRVVSLDDGSEVLPGQKGELCIRGPQRMLGYLADPDSGALTGDGWLRTGDVGYVDADGALYLVDRIKDVFKCDNELVAPAELEGVLAAHPAVAECVVVDIPHQFSGAVPYALVRIDPEFDAISPARLTEFANEQLSAYQHIRFLDVVDRIPREANGKISRRAIRERLLSAHVPSR